jgi:hypothetical protein
MVIPLSMETIAHCWIDLIEGRWALHVLRQSVAGDRKVVKIARKHRRNQAMMDSFS